MKYFSTWPRWARSAVVVAAVAVGLGLSVAAHYRHANADSAGRSELAQQFERTPHAWLDHPKDLSEFERLLVQQQIAALGVDGRRLLATTKGGERFSAELLAGSDAELARLVAASREQGFALTRIGVDARSVGQKVEASAAVVVDRAAPLLLLLCALWVGAQLVRQQRGQARLAERPATRFDDVVGAGDAKAALQQVAAFLRDPAKYLALGARPPRGVLIEGPPGTGKTMLARALAGECGASFIAVDGSHFTSMFYGQGVTKVRELFAQARAHAPCIVFIDEFDGIGARASGAKLQGGASEENRIINKLLVELDGFDEADHVVVIGATNHAGNIDAALKRPGRFDLVARVALPSLAERRELLARCLGRVKADAAIDLDALARSSSGLSHADLTNLVNRAAVRAAEDGSACVAERHLRRALESHQLGGEVSSLKAALSDADRERIAVHESGHALVAHLLGAGTVERISIEPRGAALGVTFVTRGNEVPLYGEAELRARLAMLLAGREAELIRYGNTTSGAADDLKRASELALEMVASMGLSSEFGLLSLNGVPQPLIGPQLQQRALDAAKALLDAAQRDCREAIERHRAALDALVQRLLEEETVSGAALQKCMTNDE